MTRIDPPLLHEAAARFGAPVAHGWMEFSDCHSMLCRVALKNPACRDMTPGQFDALCARLATTLATAAEQPGLRASQAIRDAVRPLLAARRPRDTVMLAAYRAAGDDLRSSNRKWQINKFT